MFDIIDVFYDRYEKYYVINYRFRKSNDMYVLFKIKMIINMIYMVIGIINRNEVIVFNICYIYFWY